MSEPEAPDAPAVELVVEGVPAAMALAPNAVGPNLGAELILDTDAQPGVQSLRAGLLQAGPLAAAGVLANGPVSSSRSRWRACFPRTATASSTS